MTFKIYIVGSLANIQKIQALAHNIRDSTISAVVNDTWTSHGPDPDKYYYQYCKNRGYSYIEAIREPICQSVFETDKKFIEDADLVVMLKPCGKSACLELGYAAGLGKMTVVIRGADPHDYDRIDVMENFATYIYDNENAFLENLPLLSFILDSYGRVANNIN